MEQIIEVSREELREKIVDREENLTIIEVLPREEYAKAHLPDALNIPLEDIELMVPRLVPNLYEDLVLYSAGPDDLSKRAANLLVGMGYKNIKWYAGGKADWMVAGLPVESDLRYEGREIA